MSGHHAPSGHNAVGCSDWREQAAAEPQFLQSLTKYQQTHS
jgi:hypothetical protein